jgi:hypothetical protein
MLRLTNIEDVRCRLLSVAIVVIAVCALTVSVATRYCYAGSSSAHATTTLHKHSSPQTTQRLSKDAATWIPPVFFSANLQAATFYPRVALAGPPIPGLFFEKSLYNRPPPSSASLI